MADATKAPLQMSQQFADLMFFALDHAAESINDGGTLIPFIVYEQEGKRELHRYAANTFEESLKQARTAAARLPAMVSTCVIAYDGVVTIKNAKHDAIIVEGAEQGKPCGVKLAQRYTPKALFRKFQKIGNPLSLGECSSTLKNV